MEVVGDEVHVCVAVEGDINVMFDEMTRAITEDTVRLLMHIQVEEKVEREQVAKVTGTNKDEGPSVKGPVRRTDKKIYPNDLCPCGSGKKYKNCCGRQA